MVNDTYQQFVETVHRNLGISVAAIKATEADTFFGEDAVKKKLVKGVLSYENAINRAVEQSGNAKASGQNGDSLGKSTDAKGGQISAKDLKGLQAFTAKYIQSSGKSDKKEIVNMEKKKLVDALIKSEFMSETECEALMSMSIEALQTLTDIDPGQTGGSSDEPSSDTEIITDLQSTVQGLTDKVTAADLRVTAAETVATAEKDLRLTGEYKSFLTEHHVPGDATELAATLLRLSKSDEKAFEMTKKALIAAGAAVEATFNETGSDAGEGAESAYQELQQKKEKIMTDENLSEVVAFREVGKRFPKLYASYRKETKARSN